VLQESDNFFWDNTKGALGVFNPTPFSGLTSAGINIGVYNTVGAEANLSVRGFASLGGVSIGAYGAVGSNYYLEKTTGILKRTFADVVSLIDFAAGGFQFKTSGAGAIASAISCVRICLSIIGVSNSSMLTCCPVLSNTAMVAITFATRPPSTSAFKYQKSS
jgi:hypothetical protein